MNRITWVTGNYGALTGILPGFQSAAAFTITHSLVRREDGKDLLLRTKLPGLQKREFPLDSELEGKEKAEELLTWWVSKIGAQWVSKEEPAKAE